MSRDSSPNMLCIIIVSQRKLNAYIDVAIFKHCAGLQGWTKWKSNGRCYTFICCMQGNPIWREWESTWLDFSLEHIRGNLRENNTDWHIEVYCGNNEQNAIQFIRRTQTISNNYKRHFITQQLDFRTMALEFDC